MPTSPFLSIPPERILAENTLVFAFFDAFPVSPGHTLIVTRRVVPSFFDCTLEEQRALMELVSTVKSLLDEQYHPDGYNVGFNAGSAAGQTVSHVHLHVIPRYTGDMPDPRGGVRHVIPWKANYLLSELLGEKAAPEASLVTGESDFFFEHLRPLLQRAQHIAILTAFTQRKGVELLHTALINAATQGATIEILTGDYMAITDPEALKMLLAMMEATPALQARLLRVQGLPGRSKVFHAKSWRIEGQGFGIAWVGSSNLSASALTDSIEWNLRIEQRQNPQVFARMQQEYQRLWALAHPLTFSLIADYAASRPEMPLVQDSLWEHYAPDPLPEPHLVQVEALNALEALRQAGQNRALVVLATGLGKTWLAAFDWLSVYKKQGKVPRLLFIAHRQELLLQAEGVFARLVAYWLQPPRIGRYYGEYESLNAELVFASVSKLMRRKDKLSVDYVVVDEVHHATAQSYRSILHRLEAGFLLGLTATPDRADTADVAALFDDTIAFRADIARGVEIKRLVPFSYMGIKDTIDYQHVPWRNGEFEQAALEKHALEQARMEALWEAWPQYPGQKTLIFCCTVRHSIAVKDWLSRQGVRIRAVHSGEGSDDRAFALNDLKTGQIDAICAVDLFNEGVDVPTVDRVILLRPTGSPVVFLQQLGRGLRAAPGKKQLQVLDFVGNHRVFLNRLKTLVAATGGQAGALDMLFKSTAVQLPAGCMLELSLEAKAAIEALVIVPAASLLERLYGELKDRSGARPVAAEIVARGYPLSSLKARWGSWFGFVAAEGDLLELEAWESYKNWLEGLENTALTKSFELILLEALLKLCSTAEAWTQGVELELLAVESWRVLKSRASAWQDISKENRFSTLDNPEEHRRWVQYWRKNPVDAWLRSPFFRLQGSRFCPFAVQQEHYEAFQALTWEMLEARRLQYQRRTHVEENGVRCKVIHANGKPILKLPDPRPVSLPDDLAVWLPNGTLWNFKFAKIACNVAGPLGGGQNQLGDLLQQWFGPEAGKPGTAFMVYFLRTPDGWWVEPEGEEADWPVGMQLTIEQLQQRFTNLRPGQKTCGSQSFCWLETIRDFLAPDRVALESASALGLLKEGTGYRTLGVIYRTEPGVGEITAMDFTTWQKIGGKGASKTLPKALQQRVLQTLLATPLKDQLIQRPQGQKATILSVSPQGGVSIKPDTSTARTVSLTDIAWVVFARERGGILDEALVNRYRYLPGTPKEATRWIDTGWAIGIVDRLIR
jgi:superfamily II DNA or RNA helicase/diadenosine tetraphosphate (Ap4A) HIT family hydrolase